MLLTSLLRMGLTRSIQPFIFKNEFTNRLEFDSLDQLGLYVHIPFCRTLCSFCPYCKEVYDPAKARAYKQALLREVDLTAGRLEGKKPVTSLYFGGGTPALMIDDLQDIIEKIEEYFVIRDGIGVELHPADITPVNLEKLKACGVTMVSLGIQTFEKTSLEKLGRTWEPFAKKVELVRSFGFTTVDVDLIFAIPGQTDESLARDIETAFSSGATQVSTYPFIDFTFSDNAYKPMSDNVKKKMLGKLADNTRKMGLERTSVWTFARPGTEKYSSVTREAFLGFGVSATSLLRKEFKINTFSIEEYIRRMDGNDLPTSLTLSFKERQRGAYFLFWASYGLFIDARRFEKIIGRPLQSVFGRELALAVRFGVLQKQGADYSLTEKGAELYHHIEQVYTTAYIDKMWNISRVQAFPEEIVLK